MPVKRRIAKQRRSVPLVEDHVGHLMRGINFFGIHEEDLPYAWEMLGAEIMAAWNGEPIGPMTALADPLREEGRRWLRITLDDPERPLRPWGWWTFEAKVAVPAELEDEVSALETMGQFTDADAERLEALDWTFDDESIDSVDVGYGES